MASARAKLSEESAGFRSGQPTEGMLKNASEACAEECTVGALVGQLLKEPQQPVYRNDRRLGSVRNSV